MKTTIDGKNTESTTLGVCATCPSKKETNPHSTDGWDRMVDWVCLDKDSKIIAKSVEWHEEKRIQLPIWCPKTNIKPIQKEYIYIVSVDEDMTKTFTSESFAFDAVIDYLKQKLTNKKMESLLQIVDNIKDFKKLNEFLQEKVMSVFKFNFEYVVTASYVNENFTLDSLSGVSVRDTVVAYYRK